jgi:hypothetical protein
VPESISDTRDVTWRKFYGQRGKISAVPRMIANDWVGLMSPQRFSGKVTGFHFSPWNLLLLVPLLILVTPLFNFDKPRLFGMPFFYWFQLAFVVVGVVCVGIVYAMTRNVGVTSGPDRLSVDDLDEGKAK